MFQDLWRIYQAEYYYIDTLKNVYNHSGSFKEDAAVKTYTISNSFFADLF